MCYLYKFQQVSVRYVSEKERTLYKYTGYLKRHGHKFATSLSFCHRYVYAHSELSSLCLDTLPWKQARSFRFGKNILCEQNVDGGADQDRNDVFYVLKYFLSKIAT